MLPCLTHTLNLVAIDAIKNYTPITELRDVASKIVTSIKTSLQASEFFGKCKSDVGAQDLKLVQDVPTRWNSLYLMFSRFLELKPEVVLLISNRNDIQISCDQWKLMKIFTALLEPLFNATNELSAEKHTTISKVLPMIQIMLSYYNGDASTDEEHTREFRTKISQSLRKRFSWTDKCKLYGLATLLDPIFKNVSFEPLKFLAVKDWLHQELEEKEVCHEQHAINLEVDAEPARKKAVYSSFWEEFDLSVQNKTVKEDTFKATIDVDLKRYLSCPMLNLNSDPLVWWKETGAINFPNLFRTAKKYLIIPATSVPSERVFSLAGQIITEKRNRLDPEIANMLIMLHQNIDMV